jgi:mannitol/fructose-specific phosphotransferase system IIA component
MKYIFTKSLKRSERANICRKVFKDIDRPNGIISKCRKPLLKILNAKKKKAMFNKAIIPSAIGTYTHMGITFYIIVNRTEGYDCIFRTSPIDAGYVESEYIDAMVQRDTELSTFIGNGTAIPHGVSEAKKRIKHTGISILQFPEGVDFDGNIVYLVVGIAGIGNEHLKILANLAEIVEDEEKVELLRRTTEKNYIYKLFTN